MSVGICLALFLVACTWQEVKVKMQFAPAVGDIYHFSMIMEQSVTQTLNEQAMNVEQTMGFGFSLTAAKTDEEKNVWVDVSYEWIQIKQTGPAGEIEFDSRNPSESEDASTKAFNALIGKGYSMKVSPSGEILEISGLDTMISALLNDMEIEDEELAAQMEEQFNKQYNEETLKEQMGNMVIQYPEGAVEIGDTWTASVKSSALVPLAVDTTYTLLAYQDGIATIGTSSTISSDSEASATDMGAYQIQYNLSGTQEGTTDVDTAVGWSASSTITQTVTGSMTMTMGTDEVAVPISILSIVRMEMDKE